MPCYRCAGWFWWCNSVGDVFLAYFRPLAMAYLSIVSDHVHPFMATMNPSSDGYFQQDNAPCHKNRSFMLWMCIKHSVSRVFLMILSVSV